MERDGRWDEETATKRKMEVDFRGGVSGRRCRGQIRDEERKDIEKGALELETWHPWGKRAWVQFPVPIG